MRKLILAALLIAFPLGSQDILVNNALLTSTVTSVAGVPDELFQMTVDSDSADYTGTAVTPGACSVSGSIAVTEDPTSSGLYSLRRTDTASGTATCGSDIDSLTDFTITAWVRVDAFIVGNAQRIVCKNTGAALFSWCFTVGNSVNQNLSVAFSNTSDFRDLFESDVNSFAAYDGLSTYTFVAATLTGCTAMGCAGQLYIDGLPVNTTQTGSQGGTPKSDTSALVRLLGLDTGGVNGPLVGYIDDLRVFTALTDEQVAAVYSSGRKGGI
jgi:hypothetical protein